MVMQAQRTMCSVILSDCHMLPSWFAATDRCWNLGISLRDGSNICGRWSCQKHVVKRCQVLNEQWRYPRLWRFIANPIKSTPPNAQQVSRFFSDPAYKDCWYELMPSVLVSNSFTFAVCLHQKKKRLINSTPKLTNKIFRKFVKGIFGP